MSKYSLGEADTKVYGINSNDLYVNEKELSVVLDDLDKNLISLRTYLINSMNQLNKSVNSNIVKGVRVQAFKGWAKKAKSQASASEKLVKTIRNNYKDDLYDYTLELLNRRITELEKKVNLITNEVG